MKVALFTETFVPKVDGIVTRLRFTVAELVRQGHQVLVFAPGGGSDEYAGARIIRVPGGRFPLYPELTVAFPRAFIRRELLAFQPDVIHAADPTALGLAAIYYADVLHIPLVVSYHTRLPNYLHYYRMGALEPLVWRLMRFRHNGAQLNLCTSNAMMQELRSHGIPRVALWPPAVDTDQFHPRFQSQEMRARLTGQFGDGPLMLYVGRLSAEKSIDWLKGVLQHVPRLRLALVGGGPNRAQLEQHFAGTQATFIGYLHGPELASAIASSDALVLPSRSETLGLVLIEGMAAGAIVVGARAGGVPDIVRDGETGFLFDAEVTGDLERVIAGVFAMDEASVTRVRDQARAQAQRWNWTAATHALVEHYEQVVAHPERAPKHNPPWKRMVKRVVMSGIRTALP